MTNDPRDKRSEIGRILHLKVESGSLRSGLIRLRGEVTPSDLRFPLSSLRCRIRPISDFLSSGRNTFLTLSLRPDSRIHSGEGPSRKYRRPQRATLTLQTHSAAHRRATCPAGSPPEDTRRRPRERSCTKGSSPHPETTSVDRSRTRSGHFSTGLPGHPRDR